MGQQAKSYPHGETKCLLSSAQKLHSDVSVSEAFWQLYLNLSGCRGWEQRSLHNQAAYTKRCTQVTLNTLHCHFPSELTTLATVPLPVSHLFHEALSSEDALDESELHHWEAGPPFLQPEPADTAQEAQFTTNLTHVFFGQKSCLENQAKARRKCRYTAGDGEEVITELHTIAAQAFREWVRVKDCLAECTARRHKEMAESILQWKARIVYSYYQAGILE
ncbi:hypothetical protein SCLCIDRAFT_135250 [Scleroderma citrinum Foug A]|uniref:Uncharacterized protein n=1 Tax=Scleroderma citrinum Foug A TaxID=1036808 RepID=A0A0C3D2Y4_9AGAM|nr:hypothetical protein SCLCIDRAFT_135250 [Scleroderma citrinum Foug A]